MRELQKYPRKYKKRPESWEEDYLRSVSLVARLIPYYFRPSAGLQNDSIVRDLYGKIMAGIDNKESWRNTMGIKRTPGIFNSISLIKV